jgi:catechol 2,3-dioxygenase-like lactoylglutathione lyase family enzyme
MHAPDLGLTHVALTIANADASVAFYRRYASMSPVHERRDSSGKRVIWLSDGTRPFVLVLIEVDRVDGPLGGKHHLGVGCESREKVDELSLLARREGRLLMEPTDAGYPVGYWAMIQDPDGHNLEISYGQEVGTACNRR